MSILFYCDNPLAELVRQYDMNLRQLELATTQKNRRYYNGRASAFREAIETVDIYIRSQTEGYAVPLRNTKDIIDEVKANAS